MSNLFTATAVKTDADVTVDGNVTVTKTFSLDGYVIDPSNAEIGQGLVYDGSAFVAGNISSGITEIDTGVGLVGGPITSTGSVSLDVSGVDASTYSFGDGTITFDAYGRATSASSATNLAIAPTTSITSGSLLIGRTNSNYIGISNISFDGNYTYQFSPENNNGVLFYSGYNTDTGHGGGFDIAGGPAQSGTNQDGGDIFIESGFGDGTGSNGGIYIGWEPPHPSIIKIGNTSSPVSIYSSITTITGQITTDGSTPTISIGSSTQLGTGASSTIVGIDTDGYVVLSSGTSPATFLANTAYTVATITFSSAFPTAPKFIDVQPYNVNAGAITTGANGIKWMVQKDDVMSNSFSIIMCSSTSASLAASTDYLLKYLVIG